MQQGRETQPTNRRKTSVSATVLFVAVSCLLIYVALRWMGGAVMRSLSTPETEMTTAPQQTPTAVRAELDAVPNAQEEPQAPMPTGETTQLQPTAPTPTAQSSDIKQVSDPQQGTFPVPTENTESLQETGAWRQGLHYTAKFTEEQMDAVLVLGDENGMTAAVCILSLKDGAATLVALPTNCILENGNLLQAYRAERAAEILPQTLPVQYDQYLVLPMAVIQGAIDAVGTLRVAGRMMDGTAVAVYLSEAAEAPLLRAERFSHVLSALPEKIRSLSILKLFRLKTALENEVKTNIKESDGWMLCNALRVLPSDRITEYTLPVESVSTGTGRAYRPNAALMEPILEKLYG